MRLRQSDPHAAGFRRVRRGRGFRYLDPAGNQVTDGAQRTRFIELAIPPAWNEVWICPWPTGHIQAIGADAAGRRQYLYHPQFRREQELAKHVRRLRAGAVIAVDGLTLTSRLDRQDEFAVHAIRGDPLIAAIMRRFRGLFHRLPRRGAHGYSCPSSRPTFARCRTAELSAFAYRGRRPAESRKMRPDRFDRVPAGQCEGAASPRRGFAFGNGAGHGRLKRRTPPTSGRDDGE